MKKLVIILLIVIFAIIWFVDIRAGGCDCAWHRKIKYYSEGASCANACLSSDIPPKPFYADLLNLF
jgi:hypothetical protein